MDKPESTGDPQHGGAVSTEPSENGDVLLDQQRSKAPSIVKQTMDNSESTGYLQNEGVAISEGSQDGFENGDDLALAWNASNTSTSGESTVDLGGSAETKWVFRMKVVVISILLSTTLAVCGSVQASMERREARERRERYEASMDFVHDNLRKNVERRVLAATSLSTTISATARAQGATWPFFTIPNWTEQSVAFMSLSKSITMSLVPFVSSKDRTAWEKFSLDTRVWLENGKSWENLTSGVVTERDNLNTTLRHLQELNSSGTEETVSIIEYDDGYPTAIFTVSGSSAVPAKGDLFAPFYHFTPLIDRDQWHFFNMDLLSASTIAPLLRAMLDSKQSVIGPVVLPDPISTRFSTSPISCYSLFAVPVFESPYNDTVVATVLLEITWESYFEDLLPATVDGLIAVLDYACDDNQYTFQVSGTETRFLGEGDHHDVKYESWVEKYDFSMVNPSAGVKLDTKFCPYSIRLYPSNEMWTTGTRTDGVPISTFTIAIFLAFGLTSSVFFFYDYFVQRRHATVSSFAGRLGKVVSSLFPPTVRDRVVDENFGCAASFLSDDSISSQPKSKPIAEYVPSVSVLFADIVGFTKFSSGKEPQSVFLLLETLFREFDVLANRHGDSYMAVSGLPKVREDHAVVMTKFALRLVEQTKLVVQCLSTQLGPEVEAMTIRVGINSGPVICGVLRTNRARFQLFGDTVNFASRMESTGIPGKIQISESTAKELSKVEKLHWVSKRSSLMDVKGKGYVQTYVVNKFEHEQMTESHRESDQI